MKLAKTGLAAVLLSAALSWAAPAEAATICVYDPAGKGGDFYAFMEEFATDASTWGTEIDLKAYTDEETAAKDYEAKKCDGVVATGVRLQRFNNFPSTIEAMGALPSYRLLRQMVNTISKSDGAAKKLTKGDNETVGFLPAGAVYLFVRDRNIDTVGELAGKRIATMDYDKAAPVMVNRVGAIMVPADLGSIGPKFNNGDVDAAYISAPAYRPFEMWKGLGSNGGIIAAPLAQATLQVMVRPSSFHDGFGKQARVDIAGRFDKALALVKQAENDIPSKYWVDVPSERTEEWDDMFLQVRLKLRDEVGAYSSSMLNVAASLRCKNDPARSECAERKE